MCELAVELAIRRPLDPSGYDQGPRVDEAPSLKINRRLFNIMTISRAFSPVDH